MMKKLYLLSTVLCLTILLQAQTNTTNPIDEMFNKYSEKEGFTIVTISGKMFSMLSSMDTENNDPDNIMIRLKSIRVLSVEDSLLNEHINFYTELSKKLTFSVYEELMVVREGPDITKFLIRPNGERISELLVITGGPGGNSLISIKGDFSLKNISDLSKNTGIEELKSLDKIDDKSQKAVKRE
jgi:hypothetical protein